MSYAQSTYAKTAITGTSQRELEAAALMKSAIRDNDPVMFMESEVMYGEKADVPEGEYLIPIGKADVKKQGTDVTIVAYNKMIKVALGAAAELEKEGVSAEVIDLRTLAPLDIGTVAESVRKTSRIVVAHEAWKVGGIGAEVTAAIAEACFFDLAAPPARVGAPHHPLPMAKPLRDAFIPSVASIAEAIRRVRREG